MLRIWSPWDAGHGNHDLTSNLYRQPSAARSNRNWDVASAALYLHTSKHKLLSIRVIMSHDDRMSHGDIRIVSESQEWPVLNWSDESLLNTLKTKRKTTRRSYAPPAR